jgi:small-conductance mechanosensitive channel
MGVLAISLNLLLIGLLAVDSPMLLAAWLGLLVIGLAYRTVRMNYGARSGTSV